MVLSPIDIEEAKKCGGTPVDIRYWPRQIEDLLRESESENYLTGSNTALRVAFSGVVKEFAPASLLPEAISAPAFRAMLYDLRRVKGKTIAFADWRKQREKQIDGITEIWTRLVGQKQPEAWTKIIKALKTSRAEQAVGKYRPDPKNKEQAPDIRSIGRGQAALLLSVERGRSLLTRIRSSLQSTCSGRDDECNLATPIVPRLSSYLTRQERTRAIGLTRLTEEEAEAGRAFNLMNSVDRASRQNLLVAGGVVSYLTESERSRAVGLGRLADEEAEAKRAFEQMNPVDRNWREQLLLAERLPSYLTERERVRAIGLNRLAEEEAEAKRAFERMGAADRTRRWDLMLAELRGKNEQQAQADIKKQRAEIRKEQQAATGNQDVKVKLAKAYESFLACTEGSEVNECMMAATAEGAHDLADAIDDSLGRHKDAHREDDEIRDEEKKKNTREEDYKRDRVVQAPQMRLAALQSQPSLARVFNLVVDVLIPLDKLTATDTTAPYFERDGSPSYARFGFLSAALNPASGARRVWTTCKVKLASDAAAPHDDFWPCTRAELDLFWALDAEDQFEGAKKRDTRDNLIARGALTQIDGFLNLSAVRMQGGMNEPRFDIVSLDALAAVENRETAKSGAKNGRPPLLTQRTAGLAVIDRWRDSSALIQALNSLARDSSNPILDADDLTIGYRMDVGVGSAKRMTWRSLCSRYIEFGDDTNCIEPLLTDIVPDPFHRLAYDSAIVVMPVMIKDRAGGGDKKVAFVEDTVGEWTGPPIGVDTNSINIDLSKSSAALQLGHLYSLSPDPEKPLSLPAGLRIPRQVFGGGYFFKLAPRYLGGVIRPANTSYEPVAIPRREIFAILPPLETGARRFLRHERIEAPIVTTPLPILERQFDRIADGLRETASNIVVRSEADEDNPEEFKPYDGSIKSSYRVVVPPSVSADFADRHNAFGKGETIKGKPVPHMAELQIYRDCDHKPWKGPADGLHGIDYDERNGGFPVYGFSATSLGRQEQVTNPQAKPSGDAIFRPRQSKSERRDPYYPDPAASYVVIGLRDLAGRMLPGDPLVVPVWPSGVKFPHVRPIAIEVVAKHRRGPRPASHDRILSLLAEGKDRMLRGSACLSPKSPRPATVRLDGKATIDSGSVQASHVKVELEPGESFEIDVWCLPTVDDLTKWFDAVESAALVASVNPETGESCMNCESFATQLRRLQLDDIAELARKLGRARTAANETICSSGQVKMPAGALRCVAVAAHELLLKQPTPELAARTTITATHAIPQVYAKPEVQLTLRRETLPQAKPGVPASAKQQSPVVIEGVVTVDRPTTGLFEIRAEAVSLVSCAFDDDQRRRRTPDEVARGIWPRSPVSEEHMRVRDVYGFDVAADGTVTLLREQATLLRVEDDIAEPKPDAPAREARDLAKLRERAAIKDNAGGGNIPHVNAPFKITDTRARILRLWAVAGSRTAASFRDEKGDVREMPEARTESAHQEIVLPASAAPAKVAPLTILPAFHLEQRYIQRGAKQTFAVERRVKLRIRMRRPWFTSGEGERLGIILWPPDILKGRVTDSQDSVRRDYEVAAGEKAEIVMREFRDEDIGPGGSYVTRWGLDPTKEGGKLGWITPPSAFADLGPAETDPGDSSRVVTAERMYVPRASIPIPIDEGTGPRRRTWLEAALLTFVPRFDIDHESWFCDVELRADCAPEPFMRLGLVRYQPYAPPELRVSEPVVEWLQVPQHRVVKVTIDKNEPQSLQVEMQGSSFNPRQRDHDAEDDRDITTWTNGPVMKVSVLRRRSDGVEALAELHQKEVRAGYSHKAEQTWLPRTQEEWNYWLERGVIREKEEPPPAFERKPRAQPAVKAKASADGTYLSWLAHFRLNESPLAPKEKDTIYRVLVEEVQPMLPATYDDEPHEPGEKPPTKQNQLTASGPRFAALLDIIAAPKLLESSNAGTPSKGRAAKGVAARLFRKKEVPPAADSPGYSTRNDSYG
nr:hypothetical protein CIT39_06310 [Bradyrhizobium symbiodeficiens]